MVSCLRGCTLIKGGIVGLLLSSALALTSAFAKPQQTQPQLHTAPTLVFATSLTRSSLMVAIEEKLTRAYRQMGYQIRVEQLPAGRSLAMANAGRFDGELFRIADVEHDYANLIRVPVPLATIELHAFTRQGISLPNDWTMQRNLRIGYVRGFRLAGQVQTHGQVVQVTTAAQAVQMLMQDRIDVLLDDEASVRSVLGPNFSEVSMAAPVLAQAELFHYVHQKHHDVATQLAAVLAKNTTR